MNKRLFLINPKSPHEKFNSSVIIPPLSLAYIAAMTPDTWDVELVDDNLIGYSREAEERALRLFKGMIDRKLSKIWATQASVNFANNDEVLYYAAKSGCRAVAIGFESVSLESLTLMNKNLNVMFGPDKYAEIVKKLHDHGIMVYGQTILANEMDTAETFKETVDFYNYARIDVPNPNLLVPLPGTRLFEKLKTEKRLLRQHFPGDWILYSGVKVLFKPNNLTVKQINDGCLYIYKNLFTIWQILLRAFRGFLRFKSIRCAIFLWAVNIYVRETLFNKIKRGL